MCSPDSVSQRPSNWLLHVVVLECGALTQYLDVPVTGYYMLLS